MASKQNASSAVVQTRLPLDVLEAAEAYAADLGVTVAWLLRDSLVRRLRQAHSEPETPLSPAMLDAMRALVREAMQPAPPMAATLVEPPLPPARPQQARPPRQPVPQQGDYDPAMFTLGKLCRRGHEWQGTGKTLRRKANNNCVACNDEQQRARRAQARGATV